ncbi:ASCH domain-containing protein [Calidifontibacillus erzurumensis]|uniref:ASCH domain-containing protein n=1 Tax=Calidifontibacillus erzurumensis TaxID=2741433 RepID=UPI0035B50986
MNLKVITIKQPWATLIALGEKRFETRSWQTKYRGKIAIHAGKSVDKKACDEDEIKRALLKHGISSYKDLPTGVILATANLIYCHKVKEDYGKVGKIAVTESGLIIKGDEYCFGDYTEGRYAWELSNVERLAESVPAKGQLSLWEWQLF